MTGEEQAAVVWHLVVRPDRPLQMTNVEPFVACASVEMQSGWTNHRE